MTANPMVPCYSNTLYGPSHLALNQSVQLSFPSRLCFLDMCLSYVDTPDFHSVPWLLSYCRSVLRFVTIFVTSVLQSLLCMSRKCPASARSCGSALRGGPPMHTRLQSMRCSYRTFTVRSVNDICMYVVYVLLAGCAKSKQSKGV